MTRVNKHIWPGGVGSRCTVCGSVRRDDSEAGTPLGCIDRFASAPAGSTARRIACEDSEVIMARLDDLRAERAAAIAGASEDVTGTAV